MDFLTDTVVDLLLLLKSLISPTLVDLASSIGFREASLTLSHDSEMDDKLANLNLTLNVKIEVSSLVKI